MKTYTVISPTGVTINGGILLLTDLQAKARTASLVSLGDGFCEIRQPVQFKCGEVFGYDGEVNKLLLLDMEEVTAQEAAKKKALEKEQLRLEAEQAAAAEKESLAAEAAAKAKADLLASIATAETLENLDALISPDETDQEILVAAEARATELENEQ